MNKPIEKMTVEELQDNLADWMNGDLPKAAGEIIDPFDLFDELARRNKLLVEALEIAKDFLTSDQTKAGVVWDMDSAPLHKIGESLKQSEGEP